ncbi:MAG: replication-associated recombination protein A [Desulfobacterales bacterium]|nr:replication-associated recombination protein A [Desulfobacteraceae bacterium]MBT4364049.1 replication-associated recombination protein A [Desulfobacteraceae bacterium]MBT7086254.1 replication-associated recombination protein A [Desulfobacterales bacterium]MBT7697138.1 replication-associated recombination protein A [Desulfobacterales bacterium]
MRPKNLEEFIGQNHVAGEGSLIHSAIIKDRIFSMILWGPPGCGKTTLATIIAKETSSHFIQISAVLSGVKDIRAVIEEAKNQQMLNRKRTILFVDEIHRFNKSQQDAFLQHVESGLITLIGATTENPSFEVIPALLSRCRMITLNPLSPDNIAVILDRAINDKENGLGNKNLSFDQEALNHLVNIADGDVRTSLNGLEVTASLLLSDIDRPDPEKPIKITLNDIEKALQKKALVYDKSGEEHYNIISAFHKSLRGSDPDAALYWLGRMIEAGEDPLYIARRMVRFATEDIGNADPFALSVTMNAMEAFRFLGHPEGDLALAQAVAYLATAPKSNSIYKAFGDVKETIKKTGTLPVPMHIRNAPTGLMKNLGYGKDYKYAHDFKDAHVKQEYLPEKLKDVLYYFPTDRGYEKTIKQRLDKWRAFKKNLKKPE